jgi:hypothetical protein
MLATEELFLDHQRPLVESLGFARASGRLAEGSEVVQVHRDLVVLGAEPPLEDLQGATIEGLGLPMPSRASPRPPASLQNQRNDLAPAP